MTRIEVWCAECGEVIWIDDDNVILGSCSCGHCTKDGIFIEESAG